jgi:hypothetical protein
MSFVLIVTLWSLISLIISNFRASEGLDLKMINGLTAAALVLLALFLVVAGLLKVRGERSATLTPEIA